MLFDKQISETHSDLVKSLTADSSSTISVFFFVFAGCFLALDFDTLALPPFFALFHFLRLLLIFDVENCRKIRQRAIYSL
jgi:hypothetical protein